MEGLFYLYKSIYIKFTKQLVWFGNYFDISDSPNKLNMNFAVTVIRFNAFFINVIHMYYIFFYGIGGKAEKAEQ